MTRNLCVILVVALLFSIFPSPASLIFSEVQRAYAQTTQPSPEKPAKPKISFKGGPGDTPETAVVISGAPNSRIGIDAEYYFLEKIFGRPNVDWKLKRQSVLHVKGKVFDRMELELKGGAKQDVYFDITEFFGKL